MTKRWQLEQEQMIRSPLQEVFAFFADAHNLQLLTPDFLGFTILTPAPIAMAEGAIVDYRLRLFGLPMHWRSRIDRFEPGRRFVDTQLRGPYRYWRHLHEFEESGNGTRMLDRVEYELPLGVLGSLARALFVARSLRRIFDYRRQAIERIFG